MRVLRERQRHANGACDDALSLLAIEANRECCRAEQRLRNSLDGPEVSSSNSKCGRASVKNHSVAFMELPTTDAFATRTVARGALAS